MDKIIIKDLEIYAYHGVNQQEKDLGQKFLVSAELNLDLSMAAQSDALNETVNYGQLCLELEEVFRKEKYDLIERAAQQLCDYILLNYSLVRKVKVTVKKPWAPIGRPLDYAAVQFERGWHTAYIALGSNMGDKENNIKQAIKKLKDSPRIKVSKVSAFYETEPVGVIEQDLFLNGAVQIETLLTPKELMTRLLEIEAELKRVRTIKWGPRTIDLDILLYDDYITATEDVVIPHPRMHERSFVLEPLNEIAPFVMHPVMNRRISQLLSDITQFLD